MKEIITVTPDKLARSHGGDRYKGRLFGREWAIYIPQTITRPDGKPVPEITVTIEVKED